MIIIRFILSTLPLWFGIGFLAPLCITLLNIISPETIGLSAWPASPFMLGLIIGGSWGLIAQITGRWI